MKDAEKKTENPERKRRREQLFMEAPVVTIVGQYQVQIENYDFLSSLQNNEIQVQGKTCLLVISGERLIVEYYSGDAMKISGKICSLSYREV